MAFRFLPSVYGGTVFGATSPVPCVLQSQQSKELSAHCSVVLLFIMADYC